MRGRPVPIRGVENLFCRACCTPPSKKNLTSAISNTGALQRGGPILLKLALLLSKILGCVRRWEKTKFNKVNGIVAFKPTECSLLGNQKHEDVGSKAAVGFTAEAMVSFRWEKMAGAGKTNMAHVLGRFLNPACIGEDFTIDNQIETARQGLEHYFPNEPGKVNRIWA